MLPDWSAPTGTWTVTADDFRTVEPPPVRHARGYEQFVAFAASYGTDARSLFDLWAFAHFIRAHRVAFTTDPDLERSAVVFLGNVCITNHSECYWSGKGPTLSVESPQQIVEDELGSRLEPEDRRYLGVGGTVPAVLDASENRFLEFQSVVDNWKPGAPVPRARRLQTRETDSSPTE